MEEEFGVGAKMKMGLSTFGRQSGRNPNGKSGWWATIKILNKSEMKNPFRVWEVQKREEEPFNLL